MLTCLSQMQHLRPRLASPPGCQDFGTQNLLVQRFGSCHYHCSTVLQELAVMWIFHSHWGQAKCGRNLAELPNWLRSTPVTGTKGHLTQEWWQNGFLMHMRACRLAPTCFLAPATPKPTPRLSTDIAKRLLGGAVVVDANPAWLQTFTLVERAVTIVRCGLAGTWVELAAVSFISPAMPSRKTSTVVRFW